MAGRPYVAAERLACWRGRSPALPFEWYCEQSYLSTYGIKPGMTQACKAACGRMIHCSTMFGFRVKPQKRYFKARF